MDKIKPRSFDRDLEQAKHWERKVSEELDDILVEEALRLASRAEQRNGIDITVYCFKNKSVCRFCYFTRTIERFK
jgi:hypothetical protein